MYRSQSRSLLQYKLMLTTANISELTVVKSQYLDEKLNMNSKLYNYWLLILGKERIFLARN